MVFTVSWHFTNKVNWIELKESTEELNNSEAQGLSSPMCDVGITMWFGFVVGCYSCYETQYGNQSDPEVCAP